MRKLFGIMLLSLAVGSVLAGGLERVVTTINTGTNTAGLVSTTDITGIRGWLEEIVLYTTGTGATGIVAIASVADGEASGAATINITTNTVDGARAWRPRVDTTDINGAALTSDPPTRYMLCGETLRFSVTQGGATNGKFTAVIKYESGRGY